MDVVLHLGDVKNGSSTCDDERFARLKALYDTFVYTPGDNEWTGWHRANNGGYLPTERLSKLRGAFYPRPGFASGGGAPCRRSAQLEPTTCTVESTTPAALHI